MLASFDNNFTIGEKIDETYAAFFIVQSSAEKSDRQFQLNFMIKM